MAIEKEVRAAVGAGNAVLGTKRTVKLLRNGKLQRVVAAKNCPKPTRDTLKSLAAVSGTPVEEFSGSSTELGALCGKPFSIAALGISGEAKKERRPTIKL